MSPAPLPPQTYANHKQLPVVTLLAGLVLVVEVLRSAWGVIRHPGATNGWAVLVTLALLVVWFNSREKAKLVQDRIIRLEMRDRLRRLLPAERQAAIDGIGLKQLIALRFASDVELPALVDEVLAGTLVAPDAIKRRVTTWQEDRLRV